MLPKEQQLRTAQQLKDWLRWELRRYPKGWKTLLPTENAILRRHQILLRKTEYHKNSGHKLRGGLCLLRLLRLQNRYGLHIPLNVCGRGLYIMHLGPVLMNSKSSVGENCTFHINTALVAGGTNDAAPVLGENVVVGIGAVVLGDTYVADYTAIGANSVVNKSITEVNIAVAGAPARKISDNGAWRWNQANQQQR